MCKLYLVINRRTKAISKLAVPQRLHHIVLDMHKNVSSQRLY